MRTTLLSAWLTLLFALITAPVQVTAEPGGGAASGFSEAELDQMLAPVALYPDSLLSQVLMAATYPDQVAQAAGWSKANSSLEGDAAVAAVQDRGWDPSVASLVAFPQVLEIMAEKPSWVRDLGDAFLADPEAVMDSVQHLRSKARDEGNLQTTEQQKVIVEQAPQQTTIIKIEPANPQVIYVPAYNPTVVYGTWWWPAYPPFYYYPPGYGLATGIMAGIGFGIGIGITNAIWGGFDWRRRDVNININRYNRININNRINVNKRNVSWKQRNLKRRDGARKRLKNRRPGSGRPRGADKRRDFRGRDRDRQRARNTLKDKGVDLSRDRKQLKGKEGKRVRDRVNRLDRDRKAGSGQRDRAAKRPRDGTRQAPKTRDRANRQAKKQSPSRTRQKRSRDNALKGLGSKRRSGLNSQRGKQSNRSFKRNRSGGNRSGGSRGGGRAGRSRRG